MLRELPDYLDDTKAGKRGKGKSQEQDGRADGDEREVPGFEFGGFGNAGMAHAGHEEDTGPDDPANPEEEAESDEDGDYDTGAELLLVWKDGVEDVAAVKLAGGDEVDSGNEETHPAGNEDWMGNDEGQLWVVIGDGAEEGFKCVDQ